MDPVMIGQGGGRLKFAIALMTVLLLLSVLPVPSEGAINYSLVVEGDGGFVLAGFSGSGTQDDPYVLSDVQIDASQKFHGIFVANTSKHFRIEGCVVTDAYASERDRIDIYASGSGIMLNNVANGEIVDFYAEYNVRGVTAVNCRNVTVTSSIFVNNIGAGVYFSGGAEDGCEVSNCTFFDNGIGMAVEDCQGVIVRDNVASGDAVGVELTANEGTCSNNLVLDNQLNGNEQHGILLSGVQNNANIIQGNLVVGASSGNGIYVEDGWAQQLLHNQVQGCLHAIRLGAGADSNTIKGNALSNNTYGVRIDGGADNNMVEDNSILDGSYGVFISPGKGTVITNNTIQRMNVGSSPVGIYMGVGAVRNATLSGNAITDCGVGIRAAGGSEAQSVAELYIVGNNISGSVRQGMYLIQVNDSLFNGNIIEWSGQEGIYLVSGSGNDIYGNAFLFNKGSNRAYSPLRAQAYCGNTSNDWYAETGNLWADWLSPDLNDDGIVDMPYNLSGGCQDPFPLTSITGLHIPADITPPELVTYAPQGRDAEQVDAITITFSEDMNTSSVVVMVNNVQENGTWIDRTFVLDLTLEFETDYQVAVMGQDLSGNALEQAGWAFRTEDRDAEVIGRIVDENGQPLSGVTVTVGEQQALTNVEGRFILQLSPGDHVLNLSMGGYLDKMVMVHVEPGGDQVLEDSVMQEVQDENTANGDLPLYAGIAVLLAAVVAVVLAMMRRRK